MTTAITVFTVPSYCVIRIYTHPMREIGGKRGGSAASEAFTDWGSLRVKFSNGDMNS